MANAATHDIPAEWAVFALPYGSKKPFPGSRGFKDASHGATIPANQNYGIATGWTSGLWVIDLDILGLDLQDAIATLEELLEVEIPDTFTVQTRSGGWQFYLQTREGVRIPSRIGIRQGVDIRAEGGYVLGPGSYVEADKKPAGHYRVMLDADIAETPEDLLALVAKEPEPETQPVVVDLDNAVINEQDGRLLDALERIRSAVEGVKHRELNQASLTIGGLVGAGIVTLDRAHALIKEAREANQAREKAPDGGMLNRAAVQCVARALNDGAQRPLPPNDDLFEVAADLFEGLPERTSQRAVGDPAATLPVPAILAQPVSNEAPRAVDPGPAIAPEEFWQSTPVLQHIHDFSKSSMAGPWSVLGHALARASMLIPVGQLIPPFVGSPAAINLCVAMVGISGSSKSAGAGVARRLFTNQAWTAIEKRPVGSGEGIPEAFLKTRKIDDPFDLTDKPAKITERYVDPDHAAILFEAGEIDALAAQGAGRQGSTLMPTIRQMFSGSMLGQTNATAERTRLVPEGVYRASLTVDVQPANSEALLGEGEQSGGTAQRFLWMSAGDREMDADYPEVAPVAITLPNLGAGEVIFADGIRQFVRYTKEDENRGRVEVDPLDGHAMLIREKVAACLAVLHGEVEPSDPKRLFVSLKMWALAGSVMAHSTEMRSMCQAVLAYAVEERARKEDARKVNVITQGAAQTRAEETKAEEAAVEAAVTAAHKKVLAQGAITRSALWKNVSRSAKKILKPADLMEALEDKGLVVQEHEPAGGGTPTTYVGINAESISNFIASKEN